MRATATSGCAHRREPASWSCVRTASATEPLRGRPRFRIEAEWTGTDDPTAWLAVPAAIEHMAGLLPGGWPAVRAHNRALALAARDLLCEALGVAAPCPDAMIGSLAAVPIAGGAGPEEPSAWTTDPLQDARLLQDRLEVPVIHWPSAGQRLVRVSAQLYNEPAQYERLADALSARGAGIARPAREW